ncbi:MAG TPA: DUF58 domain-containing protein [Planctomycetota bacterium]|nr:DUF58 domain-containing protein [Planctomycetota bacterium]
MANLAPEAYLRPEVIRQVQRFDLKAKFLIEGFLSGLHSSPFKGFSVEFSEHRKYVRGDDVRLVDWKLWSRTNRYYVKQFKAETNLTGHLIVDVSASMGYAGQSGSVTKLQYATYLAAAMAYMMIHQQDPVGLVTCGDALRAFLKPKSKSSHLFSILKILSETQPSGATKLAENLHQITEMIDHRGMVMLFSDLLDDSGEDKVLDALSHLRFRGHDVIVFQIFDAAEATFPFQDTMRFEDIEGMPDAIVADAPAIRKAYLAELQAFRERYKTECTKRHIDFVPVDTSESFDKPLLAYLQRRCGK